MKRNVEIKCRLEETQFHSKIQMAVEKSSQFNPVEIKQEDIFYKCSTGRMKLRIFNEEKGELIWYTRPNTSGPKLSNFVVSSSNEPRKLDLVLKSSNGYRGVVKKTRYLVIIGQTRVHFDKVEDLGAFLELEVVLMENQSVEEGEAIAKEIMKSLEIENAEIIECAYIDLIERK